MNNICLKIALYFNVLICTILSSTVYAEGVSCSYSYASPPDVSFSEDNPEIYSRETFVEASLDSGVPSTYNQKFTFNINNPNESKLVVFDTRVRKNGISNHLVLGAEFKRASFDYIRKFQNAEGDIVNINDLIPRKVVRNGVVNELSVTAIEETFGSVNNDFTIPYTQVSAEEKAVFKLEQPNNVLDRDVARQHFHNVRTAYETQIGTIGDDEEFLAKYLTNTPRTNGNASRRFVDEFLNDASLIGGQLDDININSIQWESGSKFTLHLDVQEP